jgi:hypothetical protein
VTRFLVGSSYSNHPRTYRFENIGKERKYIFNDENNVWSNNVDIENLRPFTYGTSVQLGVSRT